MPQNKNEGRSKDGVRQRMPLLTRFEHPISTCHLLPKLILQHKQCYLRATDAVDDADILRGSAVCPHSGVVKVVAKRCPDKGSFFGYTTAEEDNSHVTFESSSDVR